MAGESIAIRDVYGVALKELEEQNKKIVGLETNMASSTKSGIFGKAFPKRYLNAGVSKLGMVSMSTGSARKGPIPLVSTFTVPLTTRGAGPIRSLIAYDKLNMKLCGIYCGLSDSYDRTSRQAITDLAFVKAIPSMTMITVADAVKTKKAVFVIVDHQDPVYLRLSRAIAPVCYSEGMKFETDKGITVRDGRDMIIITTGTMLYKALAAAGFLEAKGIRVGVVGMHTIKPIDKELIIECARETDAVVIVEGHPVCGGLGGAVAEVLAEHMPVPMTHIGTTDFAESGDYEQLLVKYGHGPESIAERCAEVIKRE